MLNNINPSLKYALLGAAFGLVAIFLFNVIPRFTNIHLEDLPDHNYLPEIKQHVAEGEYTQAKNLAEYVVENDLPNRAEAKVIHDKMHRKLHTVHGRAGQVLSGFVLGKANTLEEAAGAIASDMLVVGDLRDIGVQTYRWARGEEVDKVVLGLSFVGIAAEFALPSALGVAILKTVAKLGVLTKSFMKALIKILEPVIKSGGKMTKEATALVETGNRALKSLGVSRAAVALKHVDNVEELSKLAQVGAKNPELVTRTLSNSAKLGKDGGRFGVTLLTEHGASNAKLLGTAARKGPQGIEWIRTPAKRGQYIVKARVGARALKVLHTGKAQQLFSQILLRNKDLIPWAWAALVGALVASVYCFAHALWRWLPRRRLSPPEMVAE